MSMLLLVLVSAAVQLLALLDETTTTTTSLTCLPALSRICTGSRLPPPPQADGPAPAVLERWPPTRATRSLTVG